MLLQLDKSWVYLSYIVSCLGFTYVLAFYCKTCDTILMGSICGGVLSKTTKTSGAVLLHKYRDKV